MMRHSLRPATKCMLQTVAAAAVAEAAAAASLHHCHIRHSRFSVLVSKPVVTLRFFSTNDGTELETLRELTKRVLKGRPLSPKAWSGAEMAFDVWTSPPATSEGVEWGWKLLDKMVENERHRVENTELHNRLTVGWLHRMVGAHIDCDSLQMDADAVLRKVKSYAPILDVDDKIRFMLEEAGLQHDSFINDKVNVLVPKEYAPEENQDSESMTPSARPPSVARQGATSTFDNLLHRLQQTPIGSVTEHDWKEAERVLEQLESIESAFELLDRLVEHDCEQQRVTTEWLNRIVQQWSQDISMDPADLLVRIHSYAHVKPNKDTYELIVSAIRRTSFVEKPIGSLSDTDWKQAESMLDSWTNEASGDSIRSAWKLLDRLVEEERRSDSEPRLESHQLNRLVEAWCRLAKSSASSSQDAAKILVKLNQYAPILSPDPHIYQMIVSAVSNMGLSDRSASEVNSSLSEDHAPKQPAPDAATSPDTTDSMTTITNNMIRDLVRSRKLVEAETMLLKMQEMYDSGASTAWPHIMYYSAIIDAWCKLGEGLRAEAMLKRMQEAGYKPSQANYNHVLAAWAKTGQPEKAETVLQQMQERHRAGEADAKPNSFSFSTVLSAYRRSEKGLRFAAERREALVRDMLELQQSGDPDVKVVTYNFNTALLAWARSGHRNAAERTESILREMQQLHEAGMDVKPNTFSFTQVMKANSASRRAAEAAPRMEAILKLMQELCDGGDGTVKPYRRNYVLVIAAWAKSGNDKAAQHAVRHLEEMKKRYENGDEDCKPTVFVYEQVIEALSKSKDPSDSLKLQAIRRELDRIRMENSDTAGQERKQVSASTSDTTTTREKDDSLDEKREAKRIPSSIASG